MAILMGTDLMRDPSVIAERIGRAKGSFDDHLGMTNRGDSSEGGHERFFDCVAERTEKRSEEIALGHFAQNDTADRPQNRGFWRGNVSEGEGIEARKKDESKKSMWMIDKTKREVRRMCVDSARKSRRRSQRWE